VIRQILSRRSAKYAGLLAFDVFYDKLPKPIDHRDRIDVTLALRPAPRKKSMPTQNNSVAARIRRNRALKHHSQFKSGPLPRQPNQFMPESLVELAHLLGAIRRRGQRDSPVRMQMIDMRKRQKSMQRRVNRRRNRIVPKRTEGVHPNHLVFVLNAAIPRLKCMQFFQIQRCKSGSLNASDIATAAFYPKDSSEGTIKRVRFLNFRAGIPTSEIRNAKIGA